MHNHTLRRSLTATVATLSALAILTTVSCSGLSNNERDEALTKIDRAEESGELTAAEAAKLREIIDDHSRVTMSKVMEIVGQIGASVVLSVAGSLTGVRMLRGPAKLPANPGTATPQAVAYRKPDDIAVSTKST